VTKSHVKMQFTVYRVNQGARLTDYFHGKVGDNQGEQMLAWHLPSLNRLFRRVV
jgi:hypothetical protein